MGLQSNGTDALTRRETDARTPSLRTHREQVMRRHSEKPAICNPRREVSPETNPNGTLILDFSLELRENRFLLFKPLSLWCFVTAAQADSDNPCVPATQGLKTAKRVPFGRLHVLSRCPGCSSPTSGMVLAFHGCHSDPGTCRRSCRRLIESGLTLCLICPITCLCLMYLLMSCLPHWRKSTPRKGPGPVPAPSSPQNRASSARCS